MNGMHSHSTHDKKTVTLQLRDVHCTGCADAVMEALRSNPHNTSARLDWANNVVRVDYHAGMINVGEMERLIESTGCKCAPGTPGSPGTPRHEHESRRDLQHLAHGVDVLPITMGTKHDRMQYE